MQLACRTLVTELHNIAVACAVIVGAVFVFAGVSKMVAMTPWRTDARALGVPHGVVAVIPVYELALGLGLIFGIVTPALALIAASTLAAMTLLLVKKIIDGNPPICACFGKFSRKAISPADVARNMYLIVLAIVGAVGY